MMTAPSTTASAKAPPASPPRRDRETAGGSSLVERDIRLWAGLILFVFVLTHLLNHALGIFGVEAMETAQIWRSDLWRSWPGTVLLYGAFVVHAGLALKRALSRSTWRMPLQEALQIVLGGLIPVLLVAHLVGTRYVAQFHGVDDSYRATLQNIWSGHIVTQTALLLVVWFHGVIGIHYAYRAKDWFPRWRELGLVLAFLIPVLSIAGFVAGAREAIELDVPAARWTPEQAAAYTAAKSALNKGLMGLGGAIAAFLLARELRRRFTNRIRIRYVGHGEIEAQPGLTLLEISRTHNIPHPSVCGGRGRCATCRVLVVSGLERLPRPGPIEKATLDSISAPPRVRLACNIWPAEDIAVQILLPVVNRTGALDWQEEALKWGVERDATILFADVRAFTTLSQRQLPSELVIILNRIIEELTQAIEARGGKVGMFLSDGVMAVFGQNGERRSGARDAILAAYDMLKAARALNTEFASVLPLPLRIGIGIHKGSVVLARIGDAERGFMTTALGETVSIASRLESATKELLADCVISEDAVAAAGLMLKGAVQREVHVRDRAKPLIVQTITDTAAASPPEPVKQPA